MNVGPLEFWVIVMVVVLLFGVKRLPELGSGLGSMISNFKKSFKDGQALDVTPDKGAPKDHPDNKDA
jgi:sec-independent protein translocase protein TatA